jgi:protein O-GlcNAc transferase
LSAHVSKLREAIELWKSGGLDEAEVALLADIALARGNALAAAGEPVAAIEHFDRALALRPSLGSAHVARADALERLGRADDAVAAHSRAVALGWIDAHALIRVGGLMVQLNRFENAHAAFTEAARLQPDNWRAREGVAMTLVAQRRYAEAVPALEELARMAPWVRNLPGHIFHARLQCCDWRDYHATAADIARRVRAGEAVDTPWSFLIHNADPAEQLLCARTYVEALCADVRPIRRRNRRSERIRLAYLSADFHDHATSYLAAGLFESHDRSRFETIAISYGPRDGGSMRERLLRAFDRFIDVAGRSDEAIASLMDELGVDIAVDLKGFTTGGRPRLLAYRAAPVQVSYLAYPGTLGAHFIDYIVADRHVIPGAHQAHYAERVIWMPRSYQINDASRAATPGWSRQEAGLPEDGIVFCCFNASYKISPDVFGAWMRILAAVEGSVLWLLEGPVAAMRNLRAEAEWRGIAGPRLVFAPPMPVTPHWARIQLADLFLDTSPCNAHTTASDALWAGVPLITVTGSSFAGRVATSLLHAVDMPELCVSSLADYELLAIRLATHLPELAAVRARVQEARRSGSLFDTAGYCRHVEAAFVEIHARHRRGEAPSTLDVEALMGGGAI